MRTCQQCQVSIEEDARFCGNCGATLSSVSSASPGSQKIVHVEELIGRTLNQRYRVDQKLGEGGFGAVFAGVHLQMRRPVAIKVLHPKMTTDPHMAARFQREAQAACSLRDAHTVTTHDFDRSEEGLLYIVMELIDGRNLLAEIQQCGTIPISRSLNLVDQICSSLVEAHARDIVHRDIKPENIIIEDRASQRDYVKVVDFGIAKMMHDAQGDTIARLTAAGQIFGTLEYMSPEQLGGGDIDHRSDIYSLGVMLYQMLLGVTPFRGAPSQVIAAHVNKEPEPPSAIDATIPPELDGIILRCLCKDPDGRYPDIASLRTELATFRKRPGARTSPLPSTPTARGVGEIPDTLNSAEVPAAPPRAGQVVHPSVKAPEGTSSRPKAAPIVAGSVQGPITTSPPRSSTQHVTPGLPRSTGLSIVAWLGIILGSIVALALMVVLIVKLLPRQDQPVAVETGTGSGAAAGKGAAVRSPDASKPSMDWSTPYALARLVEARSEMVIFLRPRELMAIPGMGRLWKKNLAGKTREFSRMVGIYPRKLDQVVLVIPKLSAESWNGKDVDPELVLAGNPVEASRVTAWFSKKLNAKQVSVRGLDVHRASSEDVSVCALDGKTLVGGKSALLERALKAAVSGASDSHFARELRRRDPTALMVLRIPNQVQTRLRVKLQMPSSSRIEHVTGFISQDSRFVDLQVHVATDSARTASHLGGLVRKGLGQGGTPPRLKAILKSLHVGSEGDELIVKMRRSRQWLKNQMRLFTPRGREIR